VPCWYSLSLLHGYQQASPLLYGSLCGLLNKDVHCDSSFFDCGYMGPYVASTDIPKWIHNFCLVVPVAFITTKKKKEKKCLL